MRPSPSGSWILLVLAGCGSGAGAAATSDGGPGTDAGGESPDGGPGAVTDAHAEGTTHAGGDASGGAEASVDASAYASSSLWLCGAGASPDYCLDAQSITAIHPDLSQTVSAIVPTSAPSLDCFYVYPSVDITSPPGNETNFDNLVDILDPVHEQAAPFTQVCRVYAPLYHQATFQSYSSPNVDEYLEIAYADIAAAFAEYLAKFNAGRPFVLLGHSQGSHMLRRLIQRVIEPSAALEKQMRLGILAGTLGDLYVPDGQVIGGSFVKTPLCTTKGQPSCVLTYDTFAKGYEPTSTYGEGFVIPAGMDIGCTNPGELGGEGILANSLFFTQFKSTEIDPPQSTGVSTAFAGMATFYTGQCLKSSNGYSFFEVNPAPGTGDQRTNPIPFGDEYYTPSLIGLHLLDYAFPMGDLLAAVQARQ